MTYRFFAPVLSAQFMTAPTGRPTDILNLLPAQRRVSACRVRTANARRTSGPAAALRHGALSSRLGERGRENRARRARAGARACC